MYFTLLDGNAIFNFPNSNRIIAMINKLYRTSVYREQKAMALYSYHILLNTNFYTLDVSQILKNEPIEFDHKLGVWLPTGNGTGNWSICWRATKDGRNASVFHSNCDGKKPTLTIVQVVKDKTYVFGGYATESWEERGSSG